MSLSRQTNTILVPLIKLPKKLKKSPVIPTRPARRRSQAVLIGSCRTRGELSIIQPDRNPSKVTSHLLEALPALRDASTEKELLSLFLRVYVHPL